MNDELSPTEGAPATAEQPAPRTGRAKAHTGPLQLLFLTLTLAVFWLLWSGHYTPFLLSLGAASSVGVVLLCHKLGIVDSFSVPYHLAPRALVYLPWLAWQVVLANFEVMRHILFPRPGDEPRLLTVEPSQGSDLGCVTYANSITLTPGTITLEAEASKLTVHALTKASAEGLLEGEMDRRVTRFEGLD